MLGDKIEVENMSYLADSFPTRVDSKEAGYVDRDVEGVHPSQAQKRRIKLQLLFVIPCAEDEFNITLDGMQAPERLPRFASVRVPKGIPVARLRNFINHVEDQLHQVYGRAKRINFVMMADEESNDWTFEFDLPTFGVVYV